MKLRCIIVDDEVPSCDELSHLLTEIKDVEIVSCANNGTEALTRIKELKPDVVFLDIKMPGMDGFDVAREIIAYPNPPSIVFATAYDEYAIEAFDVKAVDYILKPFSKERLGKTVQRLKEAKVKSLDPSDLKEIVDRFNDRLSTKKFVRISVIEKGRIILLAPHEVFFCSAYEGKSKVFTRDESFFCQTTLNELEDRLKGENFFRPHRSFLINLNHIREIAPWFDGKYVITMQDSQSTEIPVSRNRAKPLREILAL